MTTLVVHSWAKVDKDGNPATVAVVDDQDEAERIALTVAVQTARTVTVDDSPLSLANARLQAGFCPDCGGPNVKRGYRPVLGDPGDVDPTADCSDCGWGY